MAGGGGYVVTEAQVVEVEVLTLVDDGRHEAEDAVQRVCMTVRGRCGCGTARPRAFSKVTHDALHGRRRFDVDKRGGGDGRRGG